MGERYDTFYIIDEDEHPKPMDEETGILRKSLHTIWYAVDTFNIPLHNPLDFIIDDFYTGSVMIM